MYIRCRALFVFTWVISLAMGTGYAQDSPSLGDLARQQRQQKVQAKTAEGKDAKSSKVITNEEIPGRARLAAGSVASGQEQEGETSQAESSGGAKQPAEHLAAEHWKSQILAQKNQITALQSQIAELNESIRFAPANCVANCVSWNEHQKEKQDQVERMQAQLEDQKKQLDEMQESARKQGYGSAVYDP